MICYRLSIPFFVEGLDGSRGQVRKEVTLRRPLYTDALEHEEVKRTLWSYREEIS
jgi:hypothetical protein